MSLTPLIKLVLQSKTVDIPGLGYRANREVVASIFEETDGDGYYVEQHSLQDGAASITSDHLDDMRDIEVYLQAQVSKMAKHGLGEKP